MIFQHTWPAILSGDMLETTRIMPSGSQVTLRPLTSIIQAVYVHNRLRWEVGRRYAVQPGAGCHAIYWKPSPARDGRAVIFSSTGAWRPAGSDYRRLEIEITAINVVTLGELLNPDELSSLSEYNLYCEGYLALGGNHGGPRNWFKTHWEARYGALDKTLEVFRLRFDLIGREDLYGYKNSDVASLQRLAGLGERVGLLSPA